MMTIQEIRNEFIRKLNSSETTLDEKGTQLIELRNVRFLADDPYIFKGHNDSYACIDYHAEYDYRLHYKNQFYKCADALIKNPLSRQAILNWMQPENEAYPYSCMGYIHYMLDMNNYGYDIDVYVHMRSNNVFRYPYDYEYNAWILEQLKSMLYKKYHICNTNIYWNVDSLHIYKDDFKFIK